MDTTEFQLFEYRNLGRCRSIQRVLLNYSKGKLNTKTYKLCVLYFDTGVYKFIKNLSAINFLALTAILMTISDFYWQWLLNIIAHFKLTDVNWCFIGVIIQVCWKNLSFKAKRNTWKVLEDVDYLKEGSGFSVYCLHEKLTIELISRIQLSTATKEYLSEFVKHYRCCIHSPNTLEWAPLSTAARTSLRVTIIVLNMVPYTPANVYFILPKYSSSALFYNCVRCFSSYRLQKRHRPASEQENVLSSVKTVRFNNLQVFIWLKMSIMNLISLFRV